MAKLNKKVSFTNAILTIEENGEGDKVFIIEEFNNKMESLGKFNLTEKLESVADLEGLKLSFDVTDSLESEF